MYPVPSVDVIRHLMVTANQEKMPRAQKNGDRATHAHTWLWEEPEDAEGEDN